jgi:hypothetical protein
MEFGRILTKDISDQGYGSRFNRVAVMFTLILDEKLPVLQKL